MKLAETEERITDLHTIRGNLQAALDPGCDDLTACANTECGPSAVCPYHHPTPTDRNPVVAFRERHLGGAGAAACAFCCVAPVLGALGPRRSSHRRRCDVRLRGTVFALVVCAPDLPGC